MKNFKHLEIGKIGLIQQTKDGVIRQIGLTEEQSSMLQIFLATLSKEEPLHALPKEYNLIIDKKD